MRACVADSQATVWNADFFTKQSPLLGQAELGPFFLSCVCTCVMSGLKRPCLMKITTFSSHILHDVDAVIAEVGDDKFASSVYRNACVLP